MIKLLTEHRFQLLKKLCHSSHSGIAASMISKGILKILEAYGKDTTTQFIRELVKERIANYMEKAIGLTNISIDNTIFSMLLSQYEKSEGTQFLKDILTVPITASIPLLQNCELDIHKIYAKYPDLSQDEVLKIAFQNRNNLEKSCLAILENIFDKKSVVPESIKEMCGLLAREIHKAEQNQSQGAMINSSSTPNLIDSDNITSSPRSSSSIQEVMSSTSKSDSSLEIDSESSNINQIADTYAPILSSIQNLHHYTTAEKVVGSFLFLRFIVPAITSPEHFDIAVPPINTDIRRGLILCSKLITHLSNDVIFESKEISMVGFNDFLLNNRLQMQQYLRYCSIQKDSIVNIGESHTLSFTEEIGEPEIETDTKEKNKWKSFDFMKKSMTIFSASNNRIQNTRTNSFSGNFPLQSTKKGEEAATGELKKRNRLFNSKNKNKSIEGLTNGDSFGSTESLDLVNADLENKSSSKKSIIESISNLSLTAIDRSLKSGIFTSHQNLKSDPKSDIVIANDPEILKMWNILSQSIPILEEAVFEEPSDEEYKLRIKEMKEWLELFVEAPESNEKAERVANDVGSLKNLTELKSMGKSIRKLSESMLNLNEEKLKSNTSISTKVKFDLVSEHLALRNFQLLEFFCNGTIAGNVATNAATGILKLLKVYGERVSEKFISKLIKQRIDLHKSSADDLANISRDNSLVSSLLVGYQKQNGDQYLKNVLESPLNIICESLQDCEMDRTKLIATYPDSPPENIDYLIQRNQTTLQFACTTIFQSIFTNKDQIPQPITRMCAYLHHYIEEAELEMASNSSPQVEILQSSTNSLNPRILNSKPELSSSENMPKRTPFSTSEKVLGSFLFLRFMIPAITNPESWGYTFKTFGQAEKRGLLLCAKLLTSLCNDCEFGKKDIALVPCNEFLKLYRTEMRDFLRHAAFVHKKLVFADQMTFQKSVLSVKDETEKEVENSIKYLGDALKLAKKESEQGIGDTKSPIFMQNPTNKGFSDTDLYSLLNADPKRNEQQKENDWGRNATNLNYGNKAETFKKMQSLTEIHQIGTIKKLQNSPSSPSILNSTNDSNLFKKSAHEGQSSFDDLHELPNFKAIFGKARAKILGPEDSNPKHIANIGKGEKRKNKTFGTTIEEKKNEKVLDADIVSFYQILGQSMDTVISEMVEQAQIFAVDDLEECNKRIMDFKNSVASFLKEFKGKGFKDVHIANK